MLRHESKKERAETDAAMAELKKLYAELDQLMGKDAAWKWRTSNLTNYKKESIEKKIKELKNGK